MCSFRWRHEYVTIVTMDIRRALEYLDAGMVGLGPTSERYSMGPSYAVRQRHICDDLP